MRHTVWMRMGATGALSLMLGACGGGGGGPVGNNNGGSMTARIDGANWSAVSANGAAGAGGIFTITGVQAGSGTGLTMTLFHIGAPGTFPMGVGSSVAGGIGAIVENSIGWTSPTNGAAGTVTVTSVSPTRIAGTFSFNASPVPPQTGATRVITQGTFDVPVTGPSTLVVPANAASKVSGTFGGAAFNAATVVTVVSPATGVLTFGASTNERTLNVIISDYTGVGTYALGSGASRNVRWSTAQAPVSAWGGTNGTSSGSVVVTSATTSRIAGTITATLQPSPGFTGSPITVSATFDVGIP